MWSAGAIDCGRSGQSRRGRIHLKIDLKLWNAALQIAGGADNRGNPYDDASLTAALVEALGRLHLQSPELLARVVAELDCCLAREAVAPSPQHVVGCAALGALQRLAASLPDPAAMSPR